MTHDAAAARMRAGSQSLSLALRRSAARHRDATALVFGGECWSYAEFDRIVDELASGLRKQGLAAGERVAVLARNSHGFMALRFALARLGAVFVPVNVMLSVADIGYVVDHCGAKLLFVDSALSAAGLAAWAGAPAAVFVLTGEADAPSRSWRSLLIEGEEVEDVASADDLLQIIYTSGTESRPKGAMLSHAAVLWQYASCLSGCGWTTDTVMLHALPLFHCAQLDAMMGPALQIGARNVIVADTEPGRLLEAIARHRVTAFFAPPTVWISLLRSPIFDQLDLSALARGYYGASTMPVAVIEELRRRLPALRLWNLYGQTEIAPVAAILQPEDHETRSGAAGRPALHVESRVVDEDMRDVPAGEVGEIVHRSPQLLSGYWRQPELDEAAFAGGWFHSGDLAVMDADGFLTIVDRKKDMIKSGGENVSSREVEEVLYSHEDVSEVAVVGLPDPVWIEAVTAFVVLKSGRAVDVAELSALCNARLSGFKRPKAIHLRGELPRNSSGKIVKRALRDTASDC